MIRCFQSSTPEAGGAISSLWRRTQAANESYFFSRAPFFDSPTSESTFAQPGAGRISTFVMAAPTTPEVTREHRHSCFGKGLRVGRGARTPRSEGPMEPHRHVSVVVNDGKIFGKTWISFYGRETRFRGDLIGVRRPREPDVWHGNLRNERSISSMMNQPFSSA